MNITAERSGNHTKNKLDWTGLDWTVKNHYWTVTLLGRRRLKAGGVIVEEKLMFMGNNI